MQKTDIADERALIENAEMAAAVASALSRLSRGVQAPDQFKASLTSARRFLQEAATGGNVISGKRVSSGSFSGELAPLSWSTRSFRKVRASQKEPMDFAVIAEFFTSMLGLLKKVEAGTPPAEIDPTALKSATTFFDALAEVLLQGLDEIELQRADRLRGEGQ